MSDKDFKVKNKLQVKGITSAGPVVSDASGNLDSTAYIATQYGGTGTSTSPNSGQILYSASGTTYAPTTLSGLDVKGATYSADAPASPFVGQVWIESDSSSDSFDPNIMRRKSFTATASQTVFTTDYTFIDGYEQVYFNGMLLLRNTDYTTSGSTSTVTLSSGAAAGDILEVVTITNLNSINTATTTTNTFTGNQIVQAKVGINTSSPDYGLTIQDIGDSQVTLKNSSGTTKAWIGTSGAIGSGSTDDLRIRSDASNIIFGFSGFEKMRIDNNGYVGIGTATPYASGGRLTVAQSAQSTTAQFINTNASWASDVVNTYSPGGTDTSNIGLSARSDGSSWITSGYGAMYFRLGTSNSNFVEAMRLIYASAGVQPYVTIGGYGQDLGVGGTWGRFGSRTDVNNIAAIKTLANASDFYVRHIEMNSVRANNSAFTYISGYSSVTGTSDVDFYIRGDGNGYSDGTWNGGGADYAEYFEWTDGNINNEDRRGYSVALVENKIKIAEEGDTPIGVISGNPSVVGDHANMMWSNKYLRDDFGSYIRDENGDRTINPEYNEEEEYVSREDRPEWDIVGLMGKLRLRKGQVTGAGWIKMRDVSETVEEWLVK